MLHHYLSTINNLYLHYLNSPFLPFPSFYPSRPCLVNDTEALPQLSRLPPGDGASWVKCCPLGPTITLQVL